nr:T-lymphocyte surface antigen Ly-9-like [Microcebus murinus]XP_012604188.1 T-lymphocyte surface antigen Ly-9-like [Microcebus murinus]
MSSLNIRDLTMEIGGLYVATIKFSSGESQQESFRVCVYEPIPQPQIVIHSSSNTSGWCNVSLECGTPGATENLAITWLSKGFPRELEQRETLVPAANSRNLSLSLPLSRLNGHLTCVFSNPADQKNATLDLETICPWRGSPQSKWLWIGPILVLVLMVSLVAGVWIWKRKNTKAERGGPAFLPEEPSSAAAPHVLSTEKFADSQTGEVNSHEPPYAEIGLLRHPKNNMEERRFHAQSPKLTPETHTIYEKIRLSPEAVGDT